MSELKHTGGCLVFENSGEIDLRSVSTFGCSVKESENPIGFFGTGLKYAIAVLLRTGHAVFIQSGVSEVKLAAQKDTIRGKTFDFIVMDGVGAADRQPLGFTTELGKTWEVWMAYRELFCNAKDEPDSRVFESASVPAPVAGKTRLVVFGEPLLKAHQDRSEFLLETKPIFKIGDIEVHSGEKRAFFYRGIKVMDFQRPALYTYNQTSKVYLTEDRTAKEPAHVQYSIAKAILSYADRLMLESVLVAGERNIEHFFDYHGWTGHEPSAEFLSTITALQRHSLSKINPTALKVWREKGHHFIDPRRIRMTKLQNATLEKAIAFCERAGFMVRDEYPIIVVEALGGEGVMAMADRIGKQILLSEAIFNQDGTKGVVRALIEEYIHLKHGFEDYSNGMQNFLFAKMVSLAEELQGEPI